MDVEDLQQQLEVALPAHARRRRDEADGAAAGELILGEQLLDQVPVPDEVDPLDPGRSFVDAGAREHGVEGPVGRGQGAVDRVALGQVQLDARHAVQGHLGAVHDDHGLRARVPGELGRGRPHAGGTANHEHPLAVVAKRIEHAHDASPRSRSDASQ